MIKILWGFIVGIMIGCMIGAYNPKLFTPTDLQICRENLETCQDILNDPHHCVSIVVETLERENESNHN